MSERNEQLLGATTLLAFLILVTYLSSTFATIQQQSTLSPLSPASILPFDPYLTISSTTLPLSLPHPVATTTTIGGKEATTVTIVIPAPKVQPEKAEPVATTTPPARKETAPATTTKEVEESPEPTIGVTTLKQALVNVLCSSRLQNVRGISGSGVIIDQDGIILTVAHIAQMQLLAETLPRNSVECVIRTGDPARATYKAKLIYISESWLAANPTTLISSQAKGTGEHDIALLAITERSDGGALPASFPFISFSHEDARTGEQVLVGGYAAQGLSTAQVRNALSPTFKQSVVTERYTFKTATQDALAIPGGEVAQEGSSGGGAANTDGELIGIISTSLTTGEYANRHVRVITPLHIEENFRREMGQSISDYLREPATSLISSYRTKVEELGTFLAEAIGAE